jgi:hypothetical protein
MSPFKQQLIRCLLAKLAQESHFSGGTEGGRDTVDDVYGSFQRVYGARIMVAKL